MKRFFAHIGRDRFSVIDGMSFMICGMLLARGQYWQAGGIYLGLFVLSIAAYVVAQSEDWKSR